MKNLVKTTITVFCIWTFFVDTCGFSWDIHNVSEYDVKAAFVYNFLKFIKLKNGKEQKDYINLCVCCPEYVQDSFQKLDGKKIGSKIIKVEFIKKNIQNKVYSCDVLFLHRNFVKSNKKLDFIRNKNIDLLTISDSKDFVQYGGIIELFTQNNKIRFKINLISAKKAKIKINARLLQLAREVIR